MHVHVVGANPGTEAAPVRVRAANLTATDALDPRADVIVAWSVLAEAEDPVAWLETLGGFGGRIVLCVPNREVHSPFNEFADRPRNPAHCTEWTGSEFAALIARSFGGRSVALGSQSAEFPHRCTPGIKPDAGWFLALVEAPQATSASFPIWPRVGLSMPTVDQVDFAVAAIESLERTYPGDLEVAIVANGSSRDSVNRLRQFAQGGEQRYLIEVASNEGYGRGANRGLDLLWQEAYFDYFGVINDDVLPATDCLAEMVWAFGELESLGHRPGILGPVSNRVVGVQQVEIGDYTSILEMLERAEAYARQAHSSVSAVEQVRGLFFLMHPDCLSDVGGFDPIFGLGNFEDDDLNVRARLAGYTLWRADGAFLHHEGSSTFRQLEIEADGNRIRNLALFLEKWGVDHYDDAFRLPIGRPWDFVCLDATPERSEHLITINGEPVDLVHQASEFELAAWIITLLRDRPRQERAAVLEALRNVA